MRAILLDGAGGPEVLRSARCPTRAPGRARWCCEVAATAVNRADLMQREGHYPPPPGASEILGPRGGGHRRRGRRRASTGWAPGDRAMALLAGGGYAERVAVPAGQLMPVPEGMDLVDAAAVPEVFLTAWQSLRRLTRLAAGRGRCWCTPRPAASARPRIQVAHELGARRHRHGARRREGRRRRRAGRASRSSSRTAASPTPCAPLTGDHGADVILDLVGAAYWAENVRALARLGRISLVGLVGGRRGGDRPVRPARPAGDDPRQHRCAPGPWRRRPISRATSRRGASRASPTGACGPVIDRVLPLDEAAEAHRMVGADATVGKVILQGLGGAGDAIRFGPLVPP